MSDETYTYHLGIYSKLLRGWKSSGPIKPGTEARIVSRSKGWELDGNRSSARMDSLCDPQIFFRNRPMLMAMDARLFEGGAFLYRPFVRGDRRRHYSVFARVEARSEAGEGQPGRKFTHFASLIVEDKWEPALIPWAASMLFDDGMRDDEGDGFPFGTPIPEKHESRMERVLPRLTRQDLGAFRGFEDSEGRPLGLHGDDDRALHVGLGEPTGGVHPQIAYARSLAAQLHEQGLVTHGRWLSFALGISVDADAPGPGFAIRIDDRRVKDGDRLIPIHFSDDDPPVITDASLDISQSENISQDRIYGINWRRMTPMSRASASGRAFRSAPLFNNAQLWPDQVGYVEERVPVPVEMRADAGSGFYGVRSPDLTSGPEASGVSLAERAEQPLMPDLAGGAGQDQAWEHAGQAPVENLLVDVLVTEASFGEAVDAASMPTSAATENPESVLAGQPVVIDWPPLPDKKHHWVLEENLLPDLRKRLEVFMVLFGLLDTGEFREFARFDGLTRADSAAQGVDQTIDLFAKAYADIGILICVYSSTGNPRNLIDPLCRLLSHDAWPQIGILASAAGSVHAQILVRLMRTEVGTRALNLYISRQGKIARDIADFDAGSRNAISAPDSSDLEALLDALAPDGEVSEILQGDHQQVWVEMNRVINEVYVRAKDIIVNHIS